MSHMTGKSSKAIQDEQKTRKTHKEKKLEFSQPLR